jgi:hypothetical protein
VGCILGEFLFLEIPGIFNFYSNLSKNFESDKFCVLQHQYQQQFCGKNLKISRKTEKEVESLKFNRLFLLNF